MRKAKKKEDKKVTLIDVAAVAGVSAITVSRVINQPEKVSPNLVKQVQKAIDALGYIPNQHASSLASSKSRVIGVAVPSLNNVVFTDVVRGIYDVFGKTNYKVLLVDTHYSPIEEERMIRTLLSQSPEALIITGNDQTRTCQNILLSSKVPVVQIMELIDTPLDMNIGISHSQAGFDVVQHFLNNGYKKIGFIGARMDTRVQQRLLGFKKALEQNGIYQEQNIVTTPEPTSIELGGELLKSLLAQSKGQLDAVFCANDDLGLGALFEAQRMNIKIPKELALCGFNDIEASKFVNPALSSVFVGRYEMGVKAAEMVIDRLNGSTEKFKVDIGYEIKQRQSSAK